MWSGHPNEQLVVEVTDLEPGTALDVGCGEGADAIWLAGDGCMVTGIDVSAKALGRAARAAEMAGAKVKWRTVGLESLENSDIAAYDLVIAFYPLCCAVTAPSSRTFSARWPPAARSWWCTTPSWIASGRSSTASIPMTTSATRTSSAH